MHDRQSMSASPTEMVKVSAAEFRRNVRTYEDIALTQPLVLTRNGREFAVMISVEEYRRLKRRDRQVLHLDNFTDADIAAVEATRAPDASQALDHELKWGREPHTEADRRQAVRNANFGIGPPRGQVLRGAPPANMLPCCPEELVSDDAGDHPRSQPPAG